MSLAEGERTVELQGTSAAYLLLHSPAGGQCQLEITGPAAAELQVTLIRLPVGMGRLTLSCERSKGAMRLTAKAHDAAVTLTTATWEPLTPNGPGEKALIVPARDWFARTELGPEKETQSRWVTVDAANR